MLQGFKGSRVSGIRGSGALAPSGPRPCELFVERCGRLKERRKRGCVDRLPPEVQSCQLG